DDYHPWALRPVVEGRSDHLLRLGIPLSVLVQASEVLNTLPRLARCTALIQRRHFPGRRRNADRLDLVPQVRIRIAVERKIPVALTLLGAGLGLQQGFQALIAFDTRGARAEAGRIRILGIGWIEGLVPVALRRLIEPLLSTFRARIKIPVTV